MAVVTFGEVMLRLSPPGNERLTQAKSLEMSFGGGEANVAVSLAQFGIPSRFVTALPDNEVGQACLNAIRAWGVDTSEIELSGGRLGIYFLEHGASQRGSNVIYDRSGSAISQASPDRFNWLDIFQSQSWFHFTGITPALSPTATQAVKEAAATAKEKGLTVSCDLNYRKKLWTSAQARETMTALMPHVDVLIANEEDAEAVFGISAHGSNVESGLIDHRKYVEVAQKLTDRFGFKAVAITLRESHSASRNGWSGLLCTNGEAHFSHHYDIQIVDRVGGGDSFAAGLIYGYQAELASQDIVEFATAASALKHTIPGDFNICSVKDVETLLKSGGSGRVQR